MNTVYIETSIISYLRQKPSRQIVTAARQLLTHRWWHGERKHYELVVSQYVIDEASAGDPILAAERLESLDGIPLLSHAPEIPKLADEIMSLCVFPEKHKSTLFTSRLSRIIRYNTYLMWNCKHIANAKILPHIHDLLAKLGIPIPIIYTPEELLSDDTESG